MEVGINRIKRLRRQMKIRCKQVKKYKATTDSNHSLPVAPNLLDQNFAVSGPNKAWVADITYVATDEGWLYLAGIKDLWNREIVGYGHEPSHDAGSRGPRFVSGRCGAASRRRADPPLGSWQPVLLRQLSETDEAVQDEAVDEPQGELLG